VLRVSSLVRFFGSGLSPSNSIILAAPPRTCTVTLVSLSLSIVRPSLRTLRNDGVLIAYIWIHGENVHGTANPLYCQRPCDCERDQSMANACIFHPFTLVAAPSDCELDQSMANTCTFRSFMDVGVLRVGGGGEDKHGEHIRGTTDPLCCQEHLWSRT